MKISPRKFSFISPILVFLAASIIWFLILAQTVSFIMGFVVLALFLFLVFWKGFLISRQTGELFGLKSRKQIFIVSLGITLGFSELIWAISFLPFSFFILGGLLAAIFAVVFNILKEHFKQRLDLFADLNTRDFNKFLTKNIILGVILIIILIFISPWLPPKTF